MTKKGYRFGITWIELLVIIAVFTVLLALLIPAILSARENTRRQACMNNMKQIGMGMDNFYQARKCFPGSAELVGTKPKRKAGGWSFLFRSMPNVDFSEWDPEYFHPTLITGLLQNQAKPNFTNICSLLCPNSVT